MHLLTPLDQVAQAFQRLPGRRDETRDPRGQGGAQGPWRNVFIPSNRFSSGVICTLGMTGDTSRRAPFSDATLRAGRPRDPLYGIDELVGG